MKRNGADDGAEKVREEKLSKRLFIGGLSWDTTEDSLRAAFERFGQIEDTRIITDRESGRSRGFGFVGFADATAAQSAISEMDGTVLDGRTVRVNEAEERRPRDGGGGDKPRGGGRQRW